MFLIRRAKADDVPTLLKLAKMVHFINLPADREIIQEKVAWSNQCFLLAADAEVGTAKRRSGESAATSRNGASARGATPTPHGEISSGLRTLTGQSPLFMFVLEDLETKGVVGTSQVVARMGGPGHPNVSLQLAKSQKWSQSLQIGVTHTVARLHLDESGPTEIGGLIVQPSLRGHRLKLGRLLSVVRFHFMGLHRELFADRVLAELMGVISEHGENPFWDHCTRAFINLTFDEADRFCQTSKEFILALFPHEDIYLSLLPPEARNVVGSVGTETAPARRMLERLGFKYYDRVDPFDAGPHLEADMDALAPVAGTRRLRFGEPASGRRAARLSTPAIVSTLDEDGEFRALEAGCSLERNGRVTVAREVMDALAASPGVECGFTPMSAMGGAPGESKAPRGAARSGSARRRRTRS
ncbi:MAG: arginine N-succinyltransferase [Phycisphaerales bacterium]